MRVMVTPPLQALELRRQILKALQDHAQTDEMAPMGQGALAKQLGVSEERLEAHFVFLERSGYVDFLHMPDHQGNRQRFAVITEAGEAYLEDQSNFEHPKGPDSPFKVVESGRDEKVHDDLLEIRAFVDRTEWVLDDEKPEILKKLDELEALLKSDNFDAGAVSRTKLYFERHKWLSPHVAALLKKTYGF